MSLLTRPLLSLAVWLRPLTSESTTQRMNSLKARSAHEPARKPTVMWIARKEPGFRGDARVAVLPVNYCLSFHLELLRRLFRLLPHFGREYENLKRFLVGVVMVMNGSELSRVLKDLQDQRQRSTAATVLGSMPKKQRRTWSGWIGKDHFWRGRRVVLPSGQVAEVYGVVRQQVIARWHDPYSVDPVKAAVFKAYDVQVFKSPAAVALGRCKRGITERPSAIKALTSRLNGCRPPRAGSKPRGRPRKYSAIPQTQER